MVRKFNLNTQQYMKHEKIFKRSKTKRACLCLLCLFFNSNNDKNYCNFASSIYKQIEFLFDETYFFKTLKSFESLGFLDREYHLKEIEKKIIVKFARGTTIKTVYHKKKHLFINDFQREYSFNFLQYLQQRGIIKGLYLEIKSILSDDSIIHVMNTPKKIILKNKIEGLS